MERFIKGDIVVVPFPYTDLSQSKSRPAFVVTKLKGNDIILCPITSQFSPRDTYSIDLHETDFSDGCLPKPSRIRPNILFTADKSIILRKKGKLKDNKINIVINKIIDIVKT